jgi:hypothetical protein
MTFELDLNRPAKAPAALACALVAVLGCTQALPAHALPADASVRNGLTAPPSDGPGYAVALEQCVTATVQAERSATFTAQMTATATTQKMAMRIELQERTRAEPVFHTVSAPGFGVWHASEPGVKIYKYVKQVTNLAAPAAYRAVVRFRWIGEKGRTIRRAELRTPRCFQPTLVPQVSQAPSVAPGPGVS